MRISHTKQDIATAALKLFLKHGYEGTSLNQIASQVGITKPAIYHHFKSKDQLFHEVLSLFFREMDQWSKARFRTCKSAKDLLRTFFELLTGFKETADRLLGKQKGKSQYSFLEVFLSASKKDPSIRRRMEEGFIHTRSFLKEELLKAQRKGEIRKDMDCETLAFMLHALIEGTGLISYIDKSVNRDTISKEMFDNIWKMVSK
jgi:AcrR family transcriptional regulator